MKPLLSALAAAMMTAVAAPIFAQSSAITTQTTVTEKTITPTVQPKEIVTTEIEFQPAATANDINLQMLRDFETVKQNDPKIAKDIARNPELVQDQSFVGKHPSLRAFLDKYPAARDEVVDSPGNFVTPVAGSKWNSHEAAGIPRD